MGCACRPEGLLQNVRVGASATSEDVKTAFRRLAKQWHPDQNPSGDAVNKFKAISEAYSVLSDGQQRADYDVGSIERSNDTDKKEPIAAMTCGKCGKITAQPRYLIFWTIFSLIYFTRRSPTQGIFCATCAKFTALKTTILSGIFGWWSIWGLIWTPIYGIRNVMGGQRPPGLESKLLWHNAVAFLSQGKAALAQALALKIVQLNGPHVQDALNLIHHVKNSYAPMNQTLANPWKKNSKINAALRGLILGFFPLALTALVLFSNGKNSANSSLPLAPSGNQFAYTGSNTNVLTPSCAAMPENGAILTGSTGRESRGHTISIKNSSTAPAIIKIRNADTGTTYLSFFVEKGQEATVGSIEDGNYKIQYAFGDELSVDCQNFKNITASSQFPDVEKLEKRYENNGVYSQRITYTLYTVPGGNIRPQNIDPAAFSAP